MFHIVSLKEMLFVNFWVFNWSWQHTFTANSAGMQSESLVIQDPPKARSSDGENSASCSSTTLRCHAADLRGDGWVVGVLAACCLAHRIHRHHHITCQAVVWTVRVRVLHLKPLLSSLCFLLVRDKHVDLMSCQRQACGADVLSETSMWCWCLVRDKHVVLMSSQRQACGADV